MTPDAAGPGFLPGDLGDGLILRQATAEDTEAAAEFQAQVHLPHMFAESFRIWTRDLMSGALPRFQPGDFTLVEDMGTGAIASMLNLIPQTWSYGGIEISAGRIELVSTHPDYRRRGLVRAQMDAVHEMSARRGEKMQVISGIPWFYRQFGYEMALEFGMGYSCPVSNWPALDDAVREPYTVRPATAGRLGIHSSPVRGGNGALPGLLRPRREAVAVRAERAEQEHLFRAGDVHRGGRDW